MHSDPKPRRKTKQKTKLRDGALPVTQRTRPSHCELGDWVQYTDGRVARVTAFLGGRALGRYQTPQGEGEILVLPETHIVMYIPL